MASNVMALAGEPVSSCAAAMRELLANLSHLKLVIGAAGVIVALLVDSKLGPAEDDLPLRFRVILAVPVIVAIFHEQRLSEEQRAGELPYLFCFFIVALLAYSMIWLLLGYRKETATPRPWWRFWGGDYHYKTVRVMGGWLKQEARDTIRREGIPPQEYFEGTAYEQDRVWTRGSRACARAVLILTYIAVVLFYIATIAVTIL